MPRELEAAVLSVPHESHVARPGRDMREVPGLPVHESVARRGRGADRDGRHRHDHRRRDRQCRDAARAEAPEQHECPAENRGAHGYSTRRAEERRRPARPYEEHERARHGLPRRREQRHGEREEEETREHELVHRHVHARVERKMRAVEVAEAVPEPRPEGRERVCDAESRARMVEPPRDEVDSHGHPRREHGCGYRADRPQPAVCRDGGRQREGEQREHGPQRPDRLLETKPGHRDDGESGSAGGDGSRRATHEPPPPRRRRAARRRGRLRAAPRRSAPLPPAGAGARDPGGVDVPRSSPLRRARARRGGE